MDVQPTSDPLPPAPSPHLKVTDVADLLAVVPYLLGFHPFESVVLLAISGGRVGATGRIDLPRPGYTRRAVQSLIALVDQQEVEQVALVAYSADRPRARKLLDRMLAELRHVEVCEALYVDGERWWSQLCDGGCCRAEGHAYDNSTHPLSAAAVYQGLPALRDRSELADSIQGPPVAAITELDDRFDDVFTALLQARGLDAADLIEPLVRSGVAAAPPLETDELLSLIGLIQVPDLRDRALVLIDRHLARDHVRFWREVVAVATPALAAAPLTVLGLAAWVSGDGALMNCCTHRALDLDPHYRLAGMLADISARALPPSFWDSWRDNVEADLSRDSRGGGRGPLSPKLSA